MTSAVYRQVCIYFDSLYLISIIDGSTFGTKIAEALSQFRLGTFTEYRWHHYQVHSIEFGATFRKLCKSKRAIYIYIIVIFCRNKQKYQLLSSLD